MHFRGELLYLFAVVFPIGECQELVEVEAHVVLRVLLYGGVKDDEPLHGVFYLEDAVGRVVLVLLADEDVAYLSVAHHVLHLCLGSSGIERDGDGADAIGTEIDVHALRHVLREDGDVLLDAYTQFQHRCRDAAHRPGIVCPRYFLPLLLLVVAIKHSGTFAVLGSLTVDKRG